MIKFFSENETIYLFEKIEGWILWLIRILKIFATNIAA